MDIKLVIFDLDGTIIDTLPDMTNAARHAAAKFGTFEFGEDLVRRSIGNGIAMLVKRVFDGLGITGDIDYAKEAKEYTEYYNLHCCEETKLYENTKRVLEALKRVGIKMAVVTMKSKVPTKTVLDGMGIWDYFDIVIAADEMERPKPDAWSALECAKRLKVDPKEMLVIGDWTTDVNMGKAAGAVSVARLGGYGDQCILKESGADYYISDIIELLDIMGIEEN